MNYRRRRGNPASAGFLFAALLLFCASAFAANTSATLTADDAFGLYHGQASGAGLTLDGQSTATWQSTTKNFSFDVGAGDYLYVLAYNEPSYGPPHMYIGSFLTPAGPLASNTTDWLYYISANATPSPFLSLPSLAQVQADIAAANLAGWSTPLASAPNGSAPWSNAIPDPSAYFIWPDSLHRGSEPVSAADGHYVLFRSANSVAAIPEPETYALLLAGLGLVGFAARRRKT